MGSCPKAGARRSSSLVLCGLIWLALLASARLVLDGHRDLAYVFFALAALPWWSVLALLARSASSRASTRLVIGLSILARAAFFTHAPTGSDDVYRYLWEGRLVRAGLNPYRLAPDSPRLASLRDEAVWSRINHKSIPTVYPPAALGAFALAPSLPAWKALLGAADLGVAWALVRLLRRKGRDERWVLAWLLCPLTVCELTLDAHLDGLGIASLLGALLFSAARPLLSGLLLGASASIKLLSLGAAPTLLRRRSRAGIGLGICVLPLLAYAAASGRPGGGLDRYGRKWAAQPGAYAVLYRAAFEGVTLCRAPQEPVIRGAAPWLRRLVGSKATRAEIYADELASFLARAAVLLVFAGVVAFATVLALPLEQAALLTVGAFLLLTPALLPWYVLWVVPLGALTQGPVSRAFLLLAGLAPLAHLGYPASPPPWVAPVLHGSCWLLLVCAWLKPPLWLSRPLAPSEHIDFPVETG